MVICIPRFGIDWFVVAYAEDWDHCYEYWDDEYAKTCVLGSDNRYVLVEEWDVEVEVGYCLEGNDPPYESYDQFGL